MRAKAAFALCWGKSLKDYRQWQRRFCFVFFVEHGLGTPFTASIILGGS
jgi:hypothetical protein